MKTIITTEDIFMMPGGYKDAVCITTNGIIKNDGKAVMGAGIAKQANIVYKLDAELATHLQNSGNVPYVFNKKGHNGGCLISFPTKYNWKDKSDIHLIERSAQLLAELCDRRKIRYCYLTPPGCGCGGLDWETEVKPVIEKYLDDRFTVVIRPTNKLINACRFTTS